MIKLILDNILSGKELGFEQAGILLNAEKEEVGLLCHAADTVRRRFCGERIDLCSLISAKSGLCPEDCKFCAQSSKYETGCEVHSLVSVDDMVRQAGYAKEKGATNFCIVISGKGPTREEFVRIKEAILRINKEVVIKVDCSLGRLEGDMLKDLKDLGVSRYNHNLETSENFYENICESHSYNDRLSMVQRIKNAGLDPCCGGIIGLGEDLEERIRLMFSLKDLGVSCVPINILNPRKGTPLENIEPLQPIEIIKTIAVFRLILPKAIIKIAGGREDALRDMQAVAFKSGANGMIIGGYLTTKGRSVEQDLQMVKDLGFET